MSESDSPAGARASLRRFVGVGLGGGRGKTTAVARLEFSVDGSPRLTLAEARTRWGHRGGGEVEPSDEAEAPVSRRRVAALDRSLGRHADRRGLRCAADLAALRALPTRVPPCRCLRRAGGRVDASAWARFNCPYWAQRSRQARRHALHSTRDRAVARARDVATSGGARARHGTARSASDLSAARALAPVALEREPHRGPSTRHVDPTVRRSRRATHSTRLGAADLGDARADARAALSARRRPGVRSRLAPSSWSATSTCSTRS